MVAKVISGKNIRGVLSYNENKVKEGTAQCIMAHLFGCEVGELTFSDKLNRFEKLTSRNAKVRTNAIHISLNFAPGETFSINKLNSIASVYMEKIGFGSQPFLVYQHQDAAHPHIHILTSNVQSNGKRIDIHNIGRNQSDKARKEIEKSFGLVQAQGKLKKETSVNPIGVERAIYGKTQTKRSISNAVRMVVRNYKFTSLPEFNAALRQFNVMADRGKEGTQMHVKKGLLFSLLDAQGNKVGIPIKASSFYEKPTLPFLEKQFKLNEALRQPHKIRLKNCIDTCFRHGMPISKAAFMKALEQESIYVVLRQTVDGSTYGITFVDNKTKVVFNGSDLGKPYSAKALLSKMSDGTYPGIRKSSDEPEHHDKPGKLVELNLGIGEIVRDLTMAEQFDFTTPSSAIRRRKRKKRKKRSL